jgi:RNA binding exosome subunit
MPIYTFSPEKNLKLIQERNISFEEIIVAIENDQILDVLEHPNPKKYGNQKLYVIFAKDYVYLVPFVISENGDIFLKTIIPSRKAKQKYS